MLIFGGYKYLDSSRVIAPICLGLFFNYEFRFFARVQEYYEHKKTIVIPSIMAAVLNIGLNYYYIQKKGFKQQHIQPLSVILFLHYSLLLLQKDLLIRK